jgi:hypothetical protein
MPSISLTLRTVKGSELTWDELDANFVALKAPIEEILAGNVADSPDPYLTPVTKENSTQFSYDRLVLKGYLAFTTQELNNAKQVTTSLSSIYNSWYRFSHGASTNFPHNSAELSSWKYTAATDTLESTSNSASYIGFVSSDSYDTYRHEVVLSSTNSDDDLIATVLAFHKDDATGKEYTISFIRTAGGVSPRCAIVYNYGQSDSKVIVKDDTATIFSNADGSNGWSGKACKVLVIRNGNDFAVATTQIGDTTTYAITLSFTLSDDAVLQKFTGPKPYGYAALSQANSSFSSIKFTAVISSIYDVTNNQVWDLNPTDGTWSINPSKSIADLERGRLIYAPNLEKLYYISPSGSFDYVGSTKKSSEPPSFVNLNGAAAGDLSLFPPNKIWGFDAYDSPDLPPSLDGDKKYYTGITVGLGTTSIIRGMQIVTNWNSETGKPRGTYVRTKDDTQGTWGAWERLAYASETVAVAGSNKQVLFNDNGVLGAAALYFDKSTGRLSVNTTTSNFALNIGGDIYATGDITAFSDGRFKTNVKTIENALEKVLALRGVEYERDGRNITIFFFSNR